MMQTSYCQDGQSLKGKVWDQPVLRNGSQKFSSTSQNMEQFRKYDSKKD
jgi:hypothetical protein